ncbi:MAG: nucleotidyltransferase family protein [Sphingobacteriales bacterium]|mgnify:FL=1|nr:nucleotidyltransferase family protein [Sphingobacteriales bacterium]
MTFINEAILLAGGLGTRLRSAVPELPKCMAPVNGKPFLAYVVRYLQQQGIRRFIFALGYKHNDFDAFLRSFFKEDQYTVSIEEEPLGTGGAIRLACDKALSENVLVANGDTIFEADVAALANFHHRHQAACTLALKPMINFSRYGAVVLDKDGVIQQFREKQQCSEGLINGGMYALNTAKFRAHDLPGKFSFEKEFLEKYTAEQTFYGLPQDGYFIDIGIPEDYEKARLELKW